MHLSLYCLLFGMVGFCLVSCGSSLMSEREQSLRAGGPQFSQFVVMNLSRMDVEMSAEQKAADIDRALLYANFENRRVLEREKRQMKRDEIVRDLKMASMESERQARAQLIADRAAGRRSPYQPLYGQPSQGWYDGRQERVVPAYDIRQTGRLTQGGAQW